MSWPQRPIGCAIEVHGEEKMAQVSTHELEFLKFRGARTVGVDAVIPEEGDVVVVGLDDAAVGDCGSGGAGA